MQKQTQGMACWLPLRLGLSTPHKPLLAGFPADRPAESRFQEAEGSKSGEWGLQGEQAEIKPMFWAVQHEGLANPMFHVFMLKPLQRGPVACVTQGKD